MGEDALKSWLPLLTLPLGILGCQAQGEPDTSRTLGVDEALENIDRLDGKKVRISGFLYECELYDCGLFASEAKSKEFGDIVSKRREGELPDFLSIGYDKAFDRKAGPLAGKYVVVTGRINNDCRPGGVPSCTDRANDIEPLEIVLAPSAAGAPSS